MSEEYQTVAYKRERKFVFNRDKRTCQYCDEVLPQKQATADHVIPQGRGGSHHRSNLKCACADCNNEKGSLTLVEWREELLSKAMTAELPVSRFMKILSNIETIVAVEPYLKGENAPPLSDIQTLPDPEKPTPKLAHVLAPWSSGQVAFQQQHA